MRGRSYSLVFFLLYVTLTFDSKVISVIFGLLLSTHLGRHFAKYLIFGAMST